MKLKKMAAFLLALSTAAASFAMPVSAAELFGDIDSDNDVDAADAAWILQYAAYVGAGGTLDLKSFVNGDEEPAPPEITDTDDILTIMTWSESDMQMSDCYLEDYPDAQLQFLYPAQNGGGASETFKTMLNSGEQVDLYVAESDWVRSYIDDETIGVPLSVLGLTDTDYENGYSYAIEMCRNKNGELCGAPYLIAPGGYCYRTDLAEEYLGISSPEEMQSRISDWDGFTAAAEELRAATEGSITMTATLGGMWNAFKCETTMPNFRDGVLSTEKQGAFIDLAQTWIQNGYVNPAIEQWTSDWTYIGQNGETLGYFYSTWCLEPEMIFEQNGGTEGNWAITAGPQEYYWGSGILCISPSCNSASEAERFLRYFTVDADSMQKFSEYSGHMVNHQAAVEAIIASGKHTSPMLGGSDPYTVLNETAKTLDFSAELATAADTTLDDLFFMTFRNDYNESKEVILSNYEESAAAALDTAAE
ncbi:MAG: carbohydrate ABC transporter substrate-binding protein [Oscillospiraceae bacterium]|nr:carbohydrate ABC transporter substrate-binding protein [Oscillospiraceae bacterium]